MLEITNVIQSVNDVKREDILKHKTKMIKSKNPPILIIAETMPLEPEEIIFNDLNGVLAEVKEVDWDDFL